MLGIGKPKKPILGHGYHTDFTLINGLKASASNPCGIGVESVAGFAHPGSPDGSRRQFECSMMYGLRGWLDFITGCGRFR